MDVWNYKHISDSPLYLKKVSHNSIYLHNKFDVYLIRTGFLLSHFDSFQVFHTWMYI